MLSYYQAHPDQLKRPVVDAMFQAMVIPTTVAAQHMGGRQR
jgi:hypothetical protein